MQLFLNQLQGVPIISSHTEQTLGKVAGAIFDPENGTLLALSLDKTAETIVSTTDIIHIHRNEVLINDDNAVINSNEILRVKVIINSGIFFLNNYVYTENKEFLGKVIDIQINTSGYFLNALVVVKKFLIFKGDKRIISKKDILEVNQDNIVVKKSSIMKKEEVKEFVKAPV